MKKNKFKNYISYKKYLKISRLVAALIGMFAFVILLIIGMINYIGFVFICSVAIGFLWYLVVDNMADRYEERLIDLESLIKKKK